MALEKIIGEVFHNNIYWRIIRKKRPLTVDIKEHLKNMYDRIDNISLVRAKQYGWLQPLENQIQYLKKLYWDTTMFDYMISQYYKHNNMKRHYK